MMRLFISAHSRIIWLDVLFMAVLLSAFERKVSGFYLPCDLDTELHFKDYTQNTYGPYLYYDMDFLQEYFSDLATNLQIETDCKYPELTKYYQDRSYDAATYVVIASCEGSSQYGSLYFSLGSAFSYLPMYYQMHSESYMGIEEMPYKKVELMPKSEKKRLMKRIRLSAMYAVRPPSYGGTRIVCETLSFLNDDVYYKVEALFRYYLTTVSCNETVASTWNLMRNFSLVRMAMVGWIYPGCVLSESKASKVRTGHQSTSKTLKVRMGHQSTQMWI